MQPPHKKAAGTNSISKVLLYYFGNLIACAPVCAKCEMIAWLPSSASFKRHKKKRKYTFY